MSYLIGWGLIAVIAGAVALVLRKLGAPGEGAAASAARSCCNTPPEAPGAQPTRRQPRP